MLILHTKSFHQIPKTKKKNKKTKKPKLNLTWETKRVIDAATVSLSVETWALDNEWNLLGFWDQAMYGCNNSEFLSPTVKGVRDATTDGLIVIWFDF